MKWLRIQGMGFLVAIAIWGMLRAGGCPHDAMTALVWGGLLESLRTLYIKRARKIELQILGNREERLDLIYAWALASTLAFTTLKPMADLPAAMAFSGVIGACVAGIYRMQRRTYETR